MLALFFEFYFLVFVSIDDGETASTVIGKDDGLLGAMRSKQIAYISQLFIDHFELFKEMDGQLTPFVEINRTMVF